MIFRVVKVENGQIVDRFSTFVNPKVPIPFRIEKLTGINDNMVIHAPEIEEVLPKFLEFCEGAIMVAHNADFDMSFISHAYRAKERQEWLLFRRFPHIFRVVGSACR